MSGQLAPLRFERWDAIYEDLVDGSDALRAVNSFDEKRPWNTVLRLSSYGQNNEHAHWWKMHVEAPCTPGVGSATAAAMEGSEGTPDITSIRGSRSGGGSRAPKSKHTKASASANSHQSGKSKGTCFTWNSGGCQVGFDCPRGFSHTCRGCGGTHRETDCNKSNGSKGKKGSKGKGKGKNSKGKGGSPK